MLSNHTPDYNWPMFQIVLIRLFRSNTYKNKCLHNFVASKQALLSVINEGSIFLSSLKVDDLSGTRTLTVLWSLFGAQSTDELDWKNGMVSFTSAVTFEVRNTVLAYWVQFHRAVMQKISLRKVIQKAASGTGPETRQSKY